MEDSFEVSALKDHLSACKGQCKALEARVKELEAERDNLKDWKDQALRVESTWDAQAVAKLLGILWGQDIRKNIQPKVEALLTERDKLKADVARLVGAAKATILMRRTMLAVTCPGDHDGECSHGEEFDSIMQHIKTTLAAFEEAEDG